MFSQTHKKASSDISKVGSALEQTIGKKCTDALNMSSQKKFIQQFLQTASLTIKSQILKSALRNFRESVPVFINEAIPQIEEQVSDSENSTIAQYPPSVCSTQPVKKSKYNSESSDENHFDEGRTPSAKRNSASAIATGCEQRYRNNVKARKKLKKNCSDYSSVHSECKENGGSGGCLSVVEVSKPVSTYSVSYSDIYSQEESLKLHKKAAIQNIKTAKFEKTQKCLDEQKRILERQSRVSISMNFDVGQKDVHVNERDSESYDVCHGKSRTEFLQNESSLQECETLSSFCESIHGTVDESKKKKKKTKDIIWSNILDQNDDYEKLAVPQNVDLAGLDSDDEVYLLQMPKGINPKLMEGVSFSLFEKSKLKLGTEKFYIQPQYNNLKSLSIFSDDIIKTIKPLGTLKIEKKHKKTEETGEMMIEESKEQALASCHSLTLKERYKEKSRVKNEVSNYEQDELNETPPKKKKKKREYLESTSVKFPPKNELSEGHFPNSLKKRRKSILSSTRIFENLDNSDFQIDVSEIEDEKPAMKNNSDIINRLLLSTKHRLDISCEKKNKM